MRSLTGSLSTPLSKQSPLDWLASRALVYLSAAVGTAFIIVLWATINVYVWPTQVVPEPSDTTQSVDELVAPVQTIPIIEPVPTNETPLVASTPPASNLTDALVLDERKKVIGHVIALGFDLNGKVVSIVLNEDSTQQKMVAPVSGFFWEWDTANPNMPAIARVMVPGSRRYWVRLDDRAPIVPTQSSPH